MITEILHFIESVGVPNAMAVYLIYYYGKKIDRMLTLLSALAIHRGIFKQENLG